MTKSQRLNLFLKKFLSTSRLDIQTTSSRSITRLSFSSSKFSRESSSQRSIWSSSCRSLESTSDVANYNDSEDDECRSSPPDDVPAGYLPVYAGKDRRRFVIPTAYLSNRIFRALLARSEEEYGLRCEGGLRIACNPDVFEHFLWWLKGETTHYSEEMERTCSARSG